MADKWEYAELYFGNLAARGDTKPVVYVNSGGAQIPSNDKFSELLKLTEAGGLRTHSVLECLDLMGADGWELVGPPTVERLAEGGAGSSWTVRASESYYFKRATGNE